MNTLYKVYFTGFLTLSLVTTTLMVATAAIVFAINVDVTNLKTTTSNDRYVRNNASSGTDVDSKLEVFRLVESPAIYTPQSANPRGWL